MKGMRNLILDIGGWKFGIRSSKFDIYWFG